MITTMLFDVDGVLLIGEPWNKDLANSYGITNEMLSPFFHGPFQACLVGKADLKTELALYLPQWNWPQSVEAFIDYWFQRHMKDEILLQNIQQLRQQGVVCYLATQQERYRMDYILHTLGFAQLFDGYFSSTYPGYMKSDRRFFETVLRKIPNHPPEEILFWDDSPNNVATARNTGIHAELYQDIAHFRLTMHQHIHIK